MAWPFFHWDGTVTVHGDTVGRKYSNGIGGFRFVCECGYVTSQPLARMLRRAVSVHIDAQEHIDRMRGVAS
jgi:hypothetical protein